MSDNILKVPIQINGGAKAELDLTSLRDRELFLDLDNSVLYYGNSNEKLQIKTYNADWAYNTTDLNIANPKFYLTSEPTLTSQIAGFTVEPNRLERSDKQLMLHSYGNMLIESDNFKLFSDTEDENKVLISNAYISYSTIDTDSNSVLRGTVLSTEASELRGKFVKVNEGNIGNWEFKNWKNSKDGKSGTTFTSRQKPNEQVSINNRLTGLQSPSIGSYSLAVGVEDENDWSKAKFKVHHTGRMIANKITEPGMEAHYFAGQIDANRNSKFEGSLNVIEGNIAGFDINWCCFKGVGSQGYVTGVQVPVAGTTYSFVAGGKNPSNWQNSPFRVKHNGDMYAENGVVANLTSYNANINHKDGSIAGWYVVNTGGPSHYLQSYKDQQNYITMWSRNTDNDFINIKSNDSYTFNLRQDGEIWLGKIRLKKGLSYGTSLPASGEEGQLFFKI